MTIESKILEELNVIVGNAEKFVEEQNLIIRNKIVDDIDLVLQKFETFRYALKREELCKLLRLPHPLISDTEDKITEIEKSFKLPDNFRRLYLGLTRLLDGIFCPYDCCGCYC